jgi:DNA primase
MSSPVDQIKQRLSIVDVVSSYIKLEKVGANFKARCPFHSEKDPSFYVSPSREIWHCFGCLRGGDIFEFVKQIEGVEFVEALRILAERSGVVLKRIDKQASSKRLRLLELVKSAVYFYQKNLAANKEVLDYLRVQRGLITETIRNFHLGFAPFEKDGWRNLFSYLKSRGFTAAEIEEAGLVIKKEGGNYYDRFRERIIFPLFDSSSRPVGFSGRIFGEKKGEGGKYINTPQTILYNKSRLLYGFDKAKTEIRKKDACVLTEGQMDVLMSHQAGVLNAVAVSGTALTEHHLGNIKRLTNKIIMAFDSDEGGLIASKRSIDLALENGLEVLVAVLPKGNDPADLAFKNPNLWRRAVAEAVHVIDFYLDVLFEKHKDLRRLAAEVKNQVLPHLLLIEGKMERAYWVKEIAKRLGIKEEAVVEDLDKIRKEKKTADFPNVNGGKSGEGVSPGISKKRKDLLKERLAGIVLFKNDKTFLDEKINKYVLGFLKEINKEEKRKLAFEAELFYSDVDDLREEATKLSKELRKEVLKEELENLAKEVAKLEQTRSGGKDLNKKLFKFHKLSRELAQIR